MPYDVSQDVNRSSFVTENVFSIYGDVSQIQFHQAKF